jgi:VanZ family protein
MANLVMTIPLGFLSTGATWVTKPGVNRWTQVSLTLFGCVAFVMGVKFAQLYFPPRTVNLNYIVAQCLGSAVGIGLFLVSRSILSIPSQKSPDQRRHRLRLILTAYAAALFLFYLFPFDFVLSAGDFNQHIAVLPDSLFSWPGADRPRGVQLILILANVAETIPLGILLALRRHSLWGSTVIGLLMMLAITVATSFVMSATPFLVSIFLRTIGISTGASVAVRLKHVDLAKLRLLLAKLVPYFVPLYVIGVLYINGLLSNHWRTFEEARAAINLRGLLPLWHYYIVSKAHGMASLAVHTVTFVPIGLLVSLRKDRDYSGAGLAAVLAGVLSFAVEVGRAMKPGLEPDINSVLIAAASAWIAVKVMPAIWQMVEGLSEEVGASSPILKSH